MINPSDASSFPMMGNSSLPAFSLNLAKAIASWVFGMPALDARLRDSKALPDDPLMRWLSFLPTPSPRNREDLICLMSATVAGCLAALCLLPLRPQTGKRQWFEHP